MASEPPQSTSKEEPSAKMRALTTRLASARSALTASHKAVIEHLRKYPKSKQPIESGMGLAEHPEIAKRLMDESEVMKREYENAFEEYVQAVHEETMRLGEENNRETRRLTRATMTANWFIAILTIAITIATGMQAYYMAQQAKQSPQTPPVVNVTPASPAVNVAPPVVNVYPTIVVPSTPKPNQ